MTTNDWSAQVQNLEALGASFGAIQKKALRKVANVIKPRLLQAAPTRVSVKHGGNSLPEGALKAAVRGRVVAEGDEPPAAIVDFGKLSYIAHMVDVGHKPPHARALERAGHKVTGKPTPAHPFVRAVQDSSAAVAQETFEAAMTAEIEKALRG